MNAQPLNFVPASEFKQRAAAAVADEHLRKSFRGAMDFLIGKRAAQFPDPTCSNASAGSPSTSASTAWRACPSCSNSSSAS
jgi:hypothetical protein